MRTIRPLLQSPEGAEAGGGAGATGLGSAEGAGEQQGGSGESGGTSEGTKPPEGAATPPEGSQSFVQFPEGTMLGDAYKGGKLVTDYQTVLEKHGKTHLAGILGKEGYGGDLAKTLESSLELNRYVGQQIEQWDPSGLSDFQRNEMLGKLQEPTPEAYNWDLSSLQGVEVADGFKEFWGGVAQKAGASQAQFEAFIEANQSYLQQQQQEQAAAQEEALKEAANEIQGHFKAEWGDGFEERKIGVEKMIGDELDTENNEVHRAAAFDKTLLGMLAELQMLRAERRIEPGIPGTGEGGDGGASNAIQRFEEFSNAHPDYVNDPDPAIRQKGATLRDLAWAAKKRMGG